MVTLREKAGKRFGQLVQSRPLVQPGKEPKSGCRWCSLLPWSHDFDKLASGYNLDADKIRAKESEKHTVRTRCVEEEKWSQVDILFVGEAPGGDEDREGVPFIGRSGKLLREAIGAFSRVKPGQCGITNAVRCRPPRNRTPNKTEIRGCHPRLVAEITKRRPKVLVALGNTPLEALTGNTGITKYNARVMPCVLPGFEDVLVVGCFHPAYVLRADFEMERFIVALETAQAALHGEIEDKGGRGTYTVVRKLRDLKALMARLMRAKLVAVDTETGALSPFQSVFPRLLCASFSDEFGKGWVVPIDHAESPWRAGGPREDQRPVVLKLLSRFVASDVPKVLQSGKFDALHFRAALGVELHNYHDTFLDHIVTDETRGTHGLDQLAWTYTGMGGYDKPLAEYVKKNREANPEKGGSYANIPGALLFDYAGMDADVTFRVALEFQKDPEFQKNERFQLLSRKFLISLSEALTDMEFEGAQVDAEQVGVLDKKYRAEMAQNEKKIHGLKPVLKYERARSTEEGEPHTFNPGSSQQLQEVLFGLYGERPVELTDKGLETLQIRYTRSVVSWRKKRKGLKPEFRRIIKKAIERQEWNLFSTKADVLHELARNANELAPLILAWRSAETLHKTFVSPLRDLLDSNGRVHGTYNIGGTVTGRLSSSNPNLQNIPNKGGGLIKRAYVSRFGTEGILGQVDYSQIELRVAACWFKEPTMVEAYRKGADLHLQTALDISHMSLAEYKALDPHEAKRIRTQAKRINFGCVPLDTEALTRRGWRTHEQVRVGDEVLGYRDGKAAWVRVTGKVFHEVAPVVEMATENLSFETTPDHRWVAEHRVDHGRSGRAYEPREVRTGEIRPGTRIRLSAPLDAKCELPITTPEAALIGWLATDGHTFVVPLTCRTAQGSKGERRKHFGCVYQSKPEGVAALEALFASIPHTRRVRATGIHEFNVRSSYMRDLWARAQLETLSLEEFVLRLGTDELRAFVEATFLAEGSTDEKGGRILTQNEGACADALKLAVHLSGYFARQSDSDEYTRKDGVVSISTKIRFGRPFVTGQRLKPRGERMTSVWCLQTETGNWTMRHRGQIMLTGNCLYGGGPPALMSALKKEGDFLTLDECADLLRRYFAARPKLKEGIEKLESEVRRRGYLESFTGRRRRIPEVFSENEEIVARALRQSVNFPIQCGASEMTLMSLVLIWKEMRRRKYRSRMILTVHDSLVFDLHVDEAFEVLSLAKHIMENLPRLSDAVLPGIDWGWLNPDGRGAVPLVADCDIGQTWGTTIDVKDPTKPNLAELWAKMAEKVA